MNQDFLLLITRIIKLEKKKLLSTEEKMSLLERNIILMTILNLLDKKCGYRILVNHEFQQEDKQR